MSHGSSPAVVEANLAGADLVIIASTVNVATFRLMVAPTIKTFADFKGKKIAISRFGGQTDTLTRHLLDRWRLDVEQGCRTAADRRRCGNRGGNGQQDDRRGIGQSAVASKSRRCRVSNIGKFGRDGDALHQRLDRHDSIVCQIQSGYLAPGDALAFEGIKIYKTDREFSLRSPGEIYPQSRTARCWPLCGKNSVMA